MERLVITIRPAPSDEALLRVSDAMQQVMDLVRLHEEAQLGSDGPSFEWRLESAATNSPFTVVAVAAADDPAVDVAPFAHAIKRAVSVGLRNLVERGEPAPWMGPEAVVLARSVFARTQNGIGVTDLDAGTFTIDRGTAAAGMRALAGIDAVFVNAIVGDREAWGEIQGVIVAAGRYRNRPAIQMKVDQYDFVWCQLSDAVIGELGDQRISDIWTGKRLGVTGRLLYSAGGKLRIVASSIREVPDAPPVDLASLLDPDFTSGLDPVEYLRQLHEGELAG